LDTVTDKNTQGVFALQVDEFDTGKRLDVFITEKIDSVQRSRISELISKGCILVNDAPKKSSYRIKPHDAVSGVIPQLETHHFNPEYIPLDIIFEDEDILVINKQPGLVVHPAPGHWSGTLVNGLLFHYPEIIKGENDYRPGIVHRLDMDTSGVMIVAKNQKSLLALSESFQSRHVKKEYIALVHGRMRLDAGAIDSPIGRHPVDRKKMSVDSPRGKRAETHFKVEKRYNHSTLIRCDIKTGRTHQIRVHCQSIHHPIVGDPVYNSLKVNNGKSPHITEISLLKDAKRQMLHSFRLSVQHPSTMEVQVFEAPIPADMANIIEKLRNCTVSDH
jgi:23S rRNA pseudouridine1911/1915/1917 synthase